MSCYKLIEAQRTSFLVELMCRVLTVSRGGYYDWRGSTPSNRSRENATLTQRMRQIH